MQQNAEEVPEPARGFFRRLLIPDFDEVTLFSISGAAVLLLIFYGDFRAQAFGLLSANPDFKSIATLLVLIVGLLLAARRFSSTREKTESEKAAMLFFVVVVNTLAGMSAADYAFRSSAGFAAILPVWNFVNGLVLVFLLRWGVTRENKHERATDFTHVVSSLLMIAVMFAICVVGLDLHWAMTLSVCVIYACNLNAFLRDWLEARRRSARAEF